ncbi:MAG TPA: type II toxin-antitoxin system PemK/MazF family toxin [Chloroflexia bacterium]
MAASNAVYTPQRGDIVRLNFTPQQGSEQAGERPALVLSPREFNAIRGLAVVCPITNQVKGYPFEVMLPPNAGATGAVLVDHVRSVDYAARGATRIGQCPKATLGEVTGKLMVLIGVERRK